MKSQLAFYVLLAWYIVILSACGGAEMTVAPTPSQSPTSEITIATTKNPQVLVTFLPEVSNVYRTASSPLGDWSTSVYVPTNRDEPKFTTRITHIDGKPEWALDYPISQFGEEAYYFPFHWTRDGQYLYLVSIRKLGL